MRRIAAAAGMSTMNVYSRFGGKDGVLDELFVDGFRRLAAEMEDSPSTDDPLADLRQCGACYRQFARENATYYSLMFDRVVPDFEPSAAAKATALATLGQVAGRVQRAMDAGLLRPGDAFTVASRAVGLRARPVVARGAHRRRESRRLRLGHDRPARRRRAAPRVRRRIVIQVRVRAPEASVVWLVRFDSAGTDLGRTPLAADDDDWVAEVPPGTIYGLVADGDGPRFDPAKVLLDPMATEVWFPPGHDRRAARLPGVDNAGRGPLAVARPPRVPRPSRRSTRPPVVYEAHVRGLTRLAGTGRPGTYAALVEQLPRLAALGFTVVELLPVHQNDPQEGSYWGYMPLAFGAVDRRHAAGDDAADELAAFIAAAHEHDIEVWLDVVFNHTTEVDATGPTYSLRGLSDGAYYRLARRRLVHRDDRLRQRHRRRVAGCPGPHRVVAGSPRRPRCRRVPVRPRRRARP